MHITQRPSPNRNIGRQNQIPDFIVCHITGGSFTSAINTILNAANQVSYHFVIGRDGAIVQAVNIEDTAWANGTTNSGDNRDNRHSTIPAIRDRRRNANQFTTSIGFADSSGGELTAVQLSAGVELIRHIRSEVLRIYRFEIPVSRSNIIGHHEINPITRPNCPGPRFPFTEILQRVRESGLLGAQTGQTAGVSPILPLVPLPSTQPSQWAREAWEWAIGIGIIDGTNPQSIPTREQMITMLYKYDIVTA